MGRKQDFSYFEPENLKYQWWFPLQTLRSLHRSVKAFLVFSLSG